MTLNGRNARSHRLRAQHVRFMLVFITNILVSLADFDKNDSPSAECGLRPRKIGFDSLDCVNTRLDLE